MLKQGLGTQVSLMVYLLLIKRIPLARLACADELFWPFTQQGKYSCKSGYRFLKELYDGQDSSEEQPDTSFRCWFVGKVC